MKYSQGLAFSAIALAMLTTGCVKKPANNGQVVYDNSQSQGVYDTSTYDTNTYDTPTAQTGTTYDPNTTYDTASTNQSGTIYGTDTTQTGTTYDNTAVTPSGSIYTGEATDNTQITTSDVYGQPVASSNGAYNDPSASDDIYPDPYASGSQSSSTNNTYASNNNTYSSNNNTYASSSTNTHTGGNGGIQLQIAALADYYAAESFKNSLSLDPKYSAYVKKGHPNKVIVTGISSRSEANRLKDSRFPGAFIVSGGSSYSSSSYGSNSTYTTNTAYGSSASSNGFGVQIGAFSSRSKAQSAAESASSQYSPFVKKGQSNGRTIYKAILTGFSSESAARSFIANRGSGFLVHGL